MGSPPIPGLVGFEKVSPNNSSSSSEKRENENDDNEIDENIKDTSPLPPVAHQGVWATVSCLAELHTEGDDDSKTKRLVIYKLQGDISKGDELEWKVALLMYAGTAQYN